MPNIRSAKKALRQSQKRYERNKRLKMRIKRWVKKFYAVLEENLEQAKVALVTAQKLIDKAGKKNIFHKNKVARLKSRLYQAFSAKQAQK